MGAALGTGLYLYSSGDGSSFAVRMSAYFAAVVIVAWSLVSLGRAALRGVRFYGPTLMYALRSKQIVERDGLAMSPLEPTLVSATVIVLDEPLLARLLVLDPA